MMPVLAAGAAGMPNDGSPRIGYVPATGPSGALIGCSVGSPIMPVDGMVSPGVAPICGVVSPGVVKPGVVLYEIEGVSKETAVEAFNLAAHKLPIGTKFLAREMSDED